MIPGHQVGEALGLLTLLVAAVVYWRGDDIQLRAIILIFMQYCIYTTLKDTFDTWFPLLNQAVDLVLLVLVYSNWIATRRKIWGLLVFCFMGRIFWHAFAVMSDMDLTEVRYAKGNNSLYLIELTVVFSDVFLLKAIESMRRK